jgi:hypothetical protein
VSKEIEAEKLVNAALEPYAKELGLLLHDWNQLHIVLTELFLAVCQVYYSDDEDGDEERDTLLAVWNAVPNDRFQRRMLRQAATAKFSRVTRRIDKVGIDVEPIRKHEKLMLDRILWILEKADSLGQNRDSSAHVPTILDFTMPVAVIRAYDEYGHPIAKQMSGKNLPHEFGLCRARINAVSEFAVSMKAYLRGDKHGPPSLPKKPQWPSSPREGGS